MPTNLTLLQKQLNVSRETIEQLEGFRLLLLKWQQRINLISSTTEKNVWERHIIDSVQLAEYIPEGAGRLVDIGTGGGFPGLILSILAAAREVILVESDIKKSVFLREALRVTKSSATVKTERIEKIIPMEADVITARACAPLPRLLGWAKPHMKKNAICLFLKGENYTKEIEEAKKQGWNFQFQTFESRTSAQGRIIKITEIAGT